MSARGYPHIEFVSRVGNHQFVNEWYELNSQDHFWFQWRYRALKRQCLDLGIRTEKPNQVLDVGCGAGIMRDQLESNSEWIIDACDLSLECLGKLEPGRGKIFYYDILEKKDFLKEMYGIVLLFDVLEHIENTRAFIEAALWHLKPGGFLLVNVPAMPFLSSRYDEVVGHLRRYDREGLAREFSGFPVCLRDIRAWGISLIPVLCLRKLILQAFCDRAKTIQSGFAQPCGCVHSALKLMMRIETGLSFPWPWGTSFLAAVRKENG